MKIFVGKDLEISPEDKRHLEKVLRIRQGDEITLCDGEFDYVVEYGGEVVSKRECYRENKTRITLYQAVPKLSKMESIIQMASELGVNRIVPIKTRFCVADLPDDKRLERWRKVATESAKQCGRDVVLRVDRGELIEKAIQNAPKNSFMLYEREEKRRLSDIEFSDDIGIFVGSEGGFASDEAKMMATVGLGGRILRTQTVGVVVSAIILNRNGEI